MIHDKDASTTALMNQKYSKTSLKSKISLKSTKSEFQASDIFDAELENIEEEGVREDDLMSCDTNGRTNGGMSSMYTNEGRQTIS